MKNFWILFLVTFLGQNVFALDVFYPNKNVVTIDSPSTFFIGSSDPKAQTFINGQKINVHSSGGFAYVVTLDEGENKFVLSCKDELKTFLINRPVKKSTNINTPPSLVEFSSNKIFLTSENNVPLRETPIDYGINRMAHFEENIPLTVDAEKNNFYRVVLGENKKAWISKTNVKAFEGYLNPPASIKSIERIDDNEYFKFIFHLDKKTPYEIVEDENFLLKFYNVKNSPENVYEFKFNYSANTGTKKLMGYSGNYDGNDFILKIRKFPSLNKRYPLKNIKIAIDAGHGGKEFGAIGCCGNKEKDINLAIAKYLQEELQKRGAKVIMTRKDDSYVGLRERVEIAKDNDAMFLISIHGNALPDNADPNKHRGTSIYFYYNQAKSLAAHILVSMNKNLGTKNDKVRQGSLALVRNTNALSILIEVAYLINPEDNALLIDTNFQKKCAESIAKGIEEFLTGNID